MKNINYCKEKTTTLTNKPINLLKNFNKPKCKFCGKKMRKRSFTTRNEYTGMGFTDMHVNCWKKELTFIFRTKGLRNATSKWMVRA